MSSTEDQETNTNPSNSDEPATKKRKLDNEGSNSKESHSSASPEDPVEDTTMVNSDADSTESEDEENRSKKAKLNLCPDTEMKNATDKTTGVEGKTNDDDEVKKQTEAPSPKPNSTSESIIIDKMDTDDDSDAPAETQHDGSEKEEGERAESVSAENGSAENGSAENGKAEIDKAESDKAESDKAESDKSESDKEGSEKEDGEKDESEKEDDEKVDSGKEEDEQPASEGKKKKKPASSNSTSDSPSDSPQMTTKTLTPTPSRVPGGVIAMALDEKTVAEMAIPPPPMHSPVGVQDLTSEHCPEDLTVSPGRSSVSSNSSRVTITTKAGKSLKALCAHGSLDLVKKAVSDGKKLSEACVFRAARNNKVAVLKYLLKERRQQFRLATLTATNHEKVLKLLQNHMDLLHPEDAKALRAQEEANKRREEERQKELQRRQKQRDQARPLEDACKSGDFETAKKLLDDGAWCTWDGFEAVLEDKNVELFRELAAQGKILSAEPEDNDFAILDSTYFDQIWTNGWGDEVKKLLDKGMKFDHENLDTDFKEQHDVLRRYVTQLRFPFQFYSGRQGVVLPKSEDALKINEKVKNFFKHKTDENMVESDLTKGFIQGFTACLDTYLQMD